MPGHVPPFPTRDMKLLTQPTFTAFQDGGTLATLAVWLSIHTLNQGDGRVGVLGCIANIENHPRVFFNLVLDK